MKRRKPDPDDDPVADVRRWRAKAYRDAGGSVKGLIALLGQSKQGRRRKTSTKAGRNGIRSRGSRAA